MKEKTIMVWEKAIPKWWLSPGYAVKSFWQRVPESVRAAFFAALAAGLLTHLYMLTNKIPNHDDLLNLTAMANGFWLGRWMTKIPMMLASEISMPWVDGGLAVLYCSLAAATTTSALQIRTRTSGPLIGLLMPTFPVVCAQMLYMHVADQFMLSLLLASLASRLALSRLRILFFPAVVLLSSYFLWGFIRPSSLFPPG